MYKIAENLNKFKEAYDLANKECGYPDEGTLRKFTPITHPDSNNDLLDPENGKKAIKIGDCPDTGKILYMSKGVLSERFESLNTEITKEAAESLGWFKEQNYD